MSSDPSTVALAGLKPAPQDLLAADEVGAELRDLTRAVGDPNDTRNAAGPGDAGAASDGTVDAMSADEMFIGDYRLVRQVGSGGMGTVWEARQSSLDRRVALKILPAHASLDSEARQRFLREARAAAGLHHTNIVPVFEVGCERRGVAAALNGRRDDDGFRGAVAGSVFYYAMQFIEGHPLDRIVRSLRTADSGGAGADEPDSGDPSGTGDATTLWRLLVPRTLRRGGALSAQRRRRWPSLASLSRGERRRYWRATVRLGAQVADALAHAHQRGIVHRDVKPANLLLDHQGVVWVADFGLAKSTDDAEALTGAGDFLGTVRYMAPERFRGQCDARADVYGLGATLYELILLRPAYDEADQLRLIERITSSPPPAPRSLMPDLPADLETILLRALDRDPARRYQTAAALAADLRRFADDQPIVARRVGTVERCWRWSRRNVPLAVLSTVLAMLVLTLAVVGPLVAYRFAQQAAAERNARRVSEFHTRQAEQAHAEAHASERLAKAEARRAAQETRRAAGETRRAERENERAEAINTFLVDMFDGMQLEERGVDVPASVVLDRAERNLDQAFADRPLLEGGVRRTLARLYMSLGEHGRMLDHAEEALRLHRPFAASDPDEWRFTRSIHCQALMSAGHYGKAEHLLWALVDEYEAVAPDDPAAIGPLTALMLIRTSRYGLHESEPVAERVLALAAAHYPRDDARYQRVARLVATSRLSRGDLAGAERALSITGDRGWDELVAAGQNADRDLIGGYAWALAIGGRTERAIAIYDVLLPADRAHLGQDHPRHREMRSRYSQVLFMDRRWNEGLAIADELYHREVAANGLENQHTRLVAESIAMIYYGRVKAMLADGQADAAGALLWKGCRDYPQEETIWIDSAVLMAAIADRSGRPALYDRFRREFLERFPSTSAPRTRERKAKCIMLAPCDPQTAATAAALARDVLDNGPGWLESFATLPLALAHLRAGRPEQAAELARPLADPAVFPNLEVPAWAVLSLAATATGDRIAAARALDSGLCAFAGRFVSEETELAAIRIRSDDWFIADVLLKEAQAALEQ